jgi:putative CocE/NonD family hydrolase
VGTTAYTVVGYGGTPLHATVYYPTDLNTGKAATGPFPVLMTQSPYGALLDYGTDIGAGGLVGKVPYLVQRGYIEVEFDVRGTGSSEGTFTLLDPIQGQDGALVAKWASKLPNASGVVGLYGASYLGIDQFETAADAGTGSDIKAMFPVVAATDPYRDLVSAGGLASVEFNLAYISGLVPGLALANPVLEGGPTELAALTNILTQETADSLPLLTSIYTGGTDAFDGPFWAARSPVSYIPQIVADGIPAYLVGGWYDLFQRGEPLNYSALQNAFDGRPVQAPMTPTQAVTGRYQLIDGDYFHVTSGDVNYRGLSLVEIELAWFDHWLKGIDTGIEQTSTPLHLWDLGTSSWREASTYPLAQSTPKTYYFQAGGGLSTQKPAAASGADPLLYTPGLNICSSSNEQQLAGALQLTLAFVNSEDPCVKHANLSQIGPSVANYTTAPFTSPTTLAGPIGATIYATATTRDTAWAVSISDVAPNGTPTQLTAGLLDGSLRAVDSGSDTWIGADGRPILPYHPYTQASQQAVTPGAVTRYDVEVFPVMDTLAPGHRLRVTVATGDFPHTLPTLPESLNMVGGIYQVQRTASAASGVELPLSTPSLFSAPAAPLSCGSASGRISGLAVGPVTLGRNRAQVRSAFIRYRASGSLDYFCLTSEGIRVGYLRGHAVLALTANGHYAIAGVHVGARVRSVARRLGLGRALALGRNVWYLGRAGAARTLFKTRGGVIEEIGLATRALTSDRAATRRFFDRLG